jgi:hypothetical protein
VPESAGGLPAERFVSKRDGWLVAVLWGASLIDFGVAAWLLVGARAEPAFLAPLLIAVGLFQLHALYATHYTFEGGELVIRSSFFRWRVPVVAIESVEPTRNPLSSPACSLDRLRVAWSGRRVMISPSDAVGFVRALLARAPQLEAAGAGARSRGIAAR